MQALPIDVAKPLVENVTLTKDYPGYLEAESTVDLVGRVNGTLQSKNLHLVPEYVRDRYCLL